MAASKEPAKPIDQWQRFGRVPLRTEDAVECGWSRAAAQQILDAAFPGRDGLSLGEARAALDAGGSGNGAAPGASDPAALARQLIDEVIEYRAERARIAGEHQAIRLAKVNLKKLLKSPDVTVAQLRALAAELGWAVREDEEGVTVPVNDLIPFFRRPVVRELLDAKMRQVKLAVTSADEPST